MNTLSLESEDALKFIISGRSFDTATSTPVAIARGTTFPKFDGSFQEDFLNAEQVRFEDILYRTSKETFFIHQHATAKFERGKPLVTDSAWELDETAAVRWIQDKNAAVMDPSGLPMPDEA